MAPRAAAAAQAEEQCSILKLIMEKGPLSGQTLVFKPEIIVRIGRIVRGNTFSIKDPGISSKHLVIQLGLDSGLGRRNWTVTDLGSSNGTILNGSQIQPSEPAFLSDGDVVKIGETTMIKVNFENNGGCSEGDGGHGRRNVRRRGRNQVVELGVIDEGSELGLEGNDLGIRCNLGGKAGKGEAGLFGDESLKLGYECEAKIGGRRTRGSKAKVLENGDEEIEQEMENLGKRIVKSSKILIKKGILETDTHQSDAKSFNVIEIEGKGGRNTNVRTRSSKKTNYILDDLKGIASAGGSRVSTRRTRSSRMEESFGEIGVDSVIDDGKKTRKGTRGRSNLRVKATALEEEQSLVHEICKEQEGGLETGVDGFVEDCIKPSAGFASMSGLKACAVGNEETVVDLEKMTLGEWFDFLEVHLPKQIIDTTEKMISAMEENVQKLNEFMLQKKSEKERDELLVNLTEY